MEFSGEYEWMKQMTIAWRELFAVAICYCVNQSKCKDPQIMNLIRSLYLYTSLFDITYRAIHISTDDNWGADALSRLDWSRFAMFNPCHEPYMTPHVPIITDF